MVQFLPGAGDFFSSPEHTHWFWGSPILLFNRYLGYF